MTYQHDKNPISPITGKEQLTIPFLEILSSNCHIFGTTNQSELSTPLNTYLKGDELEAKAFQLFGQLLKDDRFFVPGKTSKIFRKKKYNSKERAADIIFDLSITTTHFNPHYRLLFIH